MSEPRHNFFGTALGDWIERIPNELPFDAVGLWQIVPVFTHEFGLEGEPLERAVRSAVRGLLGAGAVPVEGSSGPSDWVVRTDLLGKGEDGVDVIIRYWQNLGHEPHVGDIWFALRQDVA